MISCNITWQRYCIFTFLFHLTSSSFGQSPGAPKPIVPSRFIEIEGEIKPRALDPRLTEIIEKKISITQGSIKLIVKYQKGHETWAEYTLRKAALFIPAAEKYLGTPLSPPNGTMTILELMGPTAYCGGYDDIQTNADDWAIGRPGLLFHEIGHLWFGYISHYGEWHSQGIVSFLPVAMADAGYLKLTKEEYDSIFSHCVFTSPKLLNDVPLGEYGKRSADKDQFMLYIKSFRIQYLFYKELGLEKFRNFLIQLLTERKTGTTEVIRILSENKSDTDWKNFLLGWVTQGKYNRFNWESFNDMDVDGLIDLDEIYLGLDPKNSDTDGDSFADGWEKNNGFDPKSKNSPGSYPFIAIDGLLDSTVMTPIERQSDPLGDALASTDISGGNVYLIDKRIFVRYSFHKLEKKPIQLTLHIRRKDGRNFWWQMHSDSGSAWMPEFQDGEPFDEWKSSKIAASIVESKLGQVFEASFDPVVLGITGEFQVEFKAGGYSRGKEIWDGDSTDPLNVTLDPSGFRMDGSVFDIAERTLGTIMDPAGDTGMDADIFDIKETTAAMDERNIYLGVRFHKPIVSNQWRTLTAHIKINDNSINYWVQCWGVGGYCAVMYFTEGQKFEDWAPIPRQSPDVLSDLLVARGEDIEMRIPLVAFQIPERQIIKNIAIRTIIGGTKNGKNEWSADETNWLHITNMSER